MPMRKYEKAWTELKNSPKLVLRISSHPAYHARIIKAVKKEKNMDLAYKLECSERETPVFAVLESSCDASIITFKLKMKPLYYKDSLHKQLGLS